MTDPQSNPEDHDHPKLRSRFLGSSSGDEAFHSQAPEDAPRQKCPSCGNDILILPNTPLKCGCGWSPQAKKLLVMNICIVLLFVCLSAGAWYFISHYYDFVPDNKVADQFMKKANRMNADTQWDEAIELYKQAARVSPKRAEIRMKLSKLLTSRSPEEALEEARIAVSLEPNNLEVNQNYIGLIQAYGEFKESGPIFEKMLVLYPKDMGLHLQAATYYKTLKQMDKAQQMYEEATKIEKVGDLSWACLATIYRDKGQRDNAVKTLKDGLASNPNSAALVYELGYLYASVGDTTAIPYLKKAAEMNPGLTEAVSPLLEKVTKKTGQPIYLVRLNRRGNDFLVDAVIDHKYHVWLKVDTGANLCVVPSYVVRSAGSDLRGARMIHITSVTGSAVAPMVNFSSMSVGGAEARNVATVVYDMPGQAQEGLLGISFLEHFKVYLDTNHQQLILTERRAKVH